MNGVPAIFTLHNFSFFSLHCPLFSLRIFSKKMVTYSLVIDNVYFVKTRESWANVLFECPLSRFIDDDFPTNMISCEFENITSKHYAFNDNIFGFVYYCQIIKLIIGPFWIKHVLSTDKLFKFFYYYYLYGGMSPYSKNFIEQIIFLPKYFNQNIRPSRSGNFTTVTC